MEFMVDALAPGFLIAVPQLLDGNFFRSVVYLIEHSEEGAFGVVINRPSDLMVADLLGSLGLVLPKVSESRVLIGGPVQPDRCLVLHREGDPTGGSRAITGTLFLASSQASLTRLFSSVDPEALCFAGYSGWGPGQLEKELEEGSWIPGPPNEDAVFHGDRDGLWDRSLRSLGIDPMFLVKGGMVS